MWFLHQNDISSAAYNVAFTGWINSPVNITALQNTIQLWWIDTRLYALLIGLSMVHYTARSWLSQPAYFEQINAAKVE